nr:hypothetical protein [Pigmentiphaga sp. NML030171]
MARVGQRGAVGEPANSASMRLAKLGSDPPPCDRMKRMSGQRDSTPLM